MICHPNDVQGFKESNRLGGYLAPLHYCLLLLKLCPLRKKTTEPVIGGQGPVTGDFRQAKTLIDGSRIPLRNKALFAEETVWQVFQVEVQYSNALLD